jgi:diguanylate cyclase (GGDEF)-like protein
MADSYNSIKTDFEKLQDKFPEIEKMSQDLNHRLLELYSLYQIGLALSTTLDLDEILNMFKKMFRNTLRVDRFGIFLIDRSNSTLTLQTSFGMSNNIVAAKTSFKFDEDIFGEALMFEKTIHVPDVQKEKRFKYFNDGTNNGSFLILPLLLQQNKPIGVISLYREKTDSFKKNEISLFNKIALEISKVVDKTLLFRQTKELSITDDLTGLYNRRYFNERIDREVQRSRRYKRPLAILMIDIDHFKIYNDINGHLMGDEILKRIGHTLENNVRKTDILARYGGEEFVVILPEIDKANAIQVAEKLRSTIEIKRFPHEQKQPNGKLTISVGIATLHDDSDVTKELIDFADRALYKAKADGRNRIVVYHSAMNIAQSQHKPYQTIKTKTITLKKETYQQSLF